MVIKYDPIKMYFGDNYVVCDGITIKIPSINDILEYGESNFWTFISLFCTNTTSMRLDLWNNGIDWNEITDYQLFCLLLNGFTYDKTNIICENVDFSSFKPVVIDDNKIVLVNINDPDIIIDESIYKNMVDYVRCIVDYHPKVEFASTKATKQLIIEEERMNLRMEKKKQQKEKFKSSRLFSLISACMVHPGFKYSKKELKDINIFEFLDIVKRLQIYESASSLRNGMYSGFMDVSKIDKKELDWMRDIYEK